MLTLESLVSSLIEHKVSTSALAALDGGLSLPTLSKAISGQGQLSPEKEQSLRQTIAAIHSIIAEYSHLPIDFNRVGKIKPLVEQRRSELRDQGDPIVPRCVLIRISRSAFFKRL